MTELVTMINELSQKERALSEQCSVLYDVQTAIQATLDTVIADHILTQGLLNQYRWTDVSVGKYWLTMIGWPKSDAIDPLREFLDDDDDRIQTISFGPNDRVTLRADACCYDLRIDIPTDLKTLVTVLTWLAQLHLTIDVTPLHDQLRENQNRIAKMEQELTTVQSLIGGE